MAETVTLYKCKSCGNVIQNPEDGFVVHGNIYVADPDHISGLIGNNFPQDVDACKVDTVFDCVGQTAYCTPCFLSACNIKVTQTR